MAEQRTFVFSVTFIVIFSVLVATIPNGLLGAGANPDMVTALDPSIVAGFSASESYQYDNFTTGTYTYDLNSRTWLCLAPSSGFALGAKVLILGFLWFGVVDSVTFYSSNGTDRGESLLFTEITTDATEGNANYEIRYTGNGNAAGSFIVYWNTTAYTDPAYAWGNDSLWILHGVGLESAAVIDVGSLLLDLLTLQLPDVPLLINIIIIVPIWATIIYLIWYFVKEMIPFL